MWVIVKAKLIFDVSIVKVWVFVSLWSEFDVNYAVFSFDLFCIYLGAFVVVAQLVGVGDYEAKWYFR